MIDYWQMIFFNLFFTSLPPLVFGILDKDISMETLLALPELYKSGQNSEVRGSGRQGEVAHTPPWRCQRRRTGQEVLCPGYHTVTTSHVTQELPVPNLFLTCY